MKKNKSFIDNYTSVIYDSNALGKLNKEISVSSVDLKIKATHSGKMNGNFVVYTPRSMRQGVITLTQPFSKHLQKGHNGEAIGTITSADYVTYKDKYPELNAIADSIENAATDKDLVKAVKELTNHPSYKSKNFKGLGVTEVYATLYDEQLICDLRTGNSKGQVSIGGKSNKVLCSICGDTFGPKHEHKKGVDYEGETCFAIYDVMTLDHVGFVSDPADESTLSEIISDSLEDGIDITIENYKIQDNIQRNTPSMFITIEQLKELVKDSAKFVGVLSLTDSKSKEIEDTYKASLKYTRDSNYLIPSEKLLPINTDLNVAMTKKAIELLEDSKEKTELLDLLQVHLDSKFKETSVEDFLATLAIPTNVEEVVEKVVEESKVAETTIEEVVALATDTAVAVLTDSELDRIITAITAKVTESITDSLSATQTSIKDSLEQNTYSLLLDRNKALENDIKTIETTMNQLTNDYRDVIIGQILEKKSLVKTSPYFTEVLSKRDLQGLKDTLTDLTFTSEVVVKTAEETPAKENIQKIDIQDSLSKDLVVDETNKQDLDIKDSLDDKEVFRAEVARVGLAQALKNIKK